MDFEQLRILMVLAEERTFLGAANQLSTSRSRVRRKLDQLEANAGTTLLRREPGGLILTPAGTTLMRRGRSLLSDADELISHVRDVGTQPSGVLKIALSRTPTPPGWEETCRLIQSEHEALRIDFQYSIKPNTRIPAEAELALTFEDAVPSGCRALEMGEIPCRLFVNDAYRLRTPLPAELSDLRAHRLAVWRHPDRPTDALPLRDGRQFAIDPCLVSDDAADIHRAVAAGDCIGYLPALPKLVDPAFKILFEDEVSGAVQQRLIIPNILADLPRIVRFLEICASQTGLGRSDSPLA